MAPRPLSKSRIVTDAGNAARNSGSSLVVGCAIIVVSGVFLFSIGAVTSRGLLQVEPNFGGDADASRVALSISFMAIDVWNDVGLGFMYCASCSDHTALMAREEGEPGYDSVHVCAFCIENLSSAFISN